MTKQIDRSNKAAITKIRTMPFLALLEGRNCIGQVLDSLIPLDDAWQVFDFDARATLTDNGNRTYTMQNSPTYDSTKVHLISEGDRQHVDFLERDRQRAEQAARTERERRERLESKRAAYVKPVQRQYPDMIDAVRIDVPFVESAVFHGPVRFTGPDCWEQLEVLTNRTRAYLIEEGTELYAKMDFRVEFRNGAFEEGRWDICADDHDGRTLQDRILDRWLTDVGGRQVAHWTPERHEEHTRLHGELSAYALRTYRIGTNTGSTTPKRSAVHEYRAAQSIDTQIEKDGSGLLYLWATGGGKQMHAVSFRAATFGEFVIETVDVGSGHVEEVTLSLLEAAQGGFITQFSKNCSLLSKSEDAIMGDLGRQYAKHWLEQMDEAETQPLELYTRRMREEFSILPDQPVTK